MNKYEEALNELNYMLADNDNFYSEEEKQTTYNIVKEAIEKAEKWDEIIKEVNEIENNKPKMSSIYGADNSAQYISDLSNYYARISKLDYQLNEIFKTKYEKRIEELEDKCNMHNFFWEGCGFDKMGFVNSIQVREYVDELKDKAEEYDKIMNNKEIGFISKRGYDEIICENKTLKDGVKVMSDILSTLTILETTDIPNKYKYKTLDTFAFISIYEYNKIKAMLEVVENGK